MTVRILVVDDEPDVEILFRQQFRRELREGHTLDFALSGEAALGKLASQVGGQFDLLVSDINMPGMSGLDLLSEVKARRRAYRCSWSPRTATATRWLRRSPGALPGS